MARPRAGIVYIGLKAMVAALDRRTGSEVWRTPLKGGVGRSTSFVTLHRDGGLKAANPDRAVDERKAVAQLRAQEIGGSAKRYDQRNSGNEEDPDRLTHRGDP